MKDFDSISEYEVCALILSALSDKMKDLMQYNFDPDDMPDHFKASIDLVNLQHCEVSRRLVQLIHSKDKEYYSWMILF